MYGCISALYPNFQLQMSRDQLRKVQILYRIQSLKDLSQVAHHLVFYCPQLIAQSFQYLSF